MLKFIGWWIDNVIVILLLGVICINIYYGKWFSFYYRVYGFLFLIVEVKYLY